MTTTEDDLAEMTLGALGVLAAGQTPSAEDVALIKARLGKAIPQWVVREIVYVANSDEIPDEWSLPLAKMMADICAEEFGIGGEKRVQVKALAKEAEAMLRRMTQAARDEQPLRTLYY